MRHLNCLVETFLLSVWIQGLEVSSKEVGVNNLETSDSGVGFNTTLPLDTDTEAPDQISESVAVTISAARETKSSPPVAAESKPSAPPATESKPSPPAETKASPAPEKTPDQPEEVKLDVSKPGDAKQSPALTPEPKVVVTPADPKPAPDPAVPEATTPTPESKTALTPTPEPPESSAPEPITNGTPEPSPDSKPSPEHAEIINESTPKATPKAELISSCPAVEVSKDAAVAEDSTTTTWEFKEKLHSFCASTTSVDNWTSNTKKWRNHWIWGKDFGFKFLMPDQTMITVSH